MNDAFAREYFFVLTIQNTMSKKTSPAHKHTSKSAAAHAIETLKTLHTIHVNQAMNDALASDVSEFSLVDRDLIDAINLVIKALKKDDKKIEEITSYAQAVAKQASPKSPKKQASPKAPAKQASPKAPAKQASPKSPPKKQVSPKAPKKQASPKTTKPAGGFLSRLLGGAGKYGK